MRDFIDDRSFIFSVFLVDQFRLREQDVSQSVSKIRLSVFCLENLFVFNIKVKSYLRNRRNISSRVRDPRLLSMKQTKFYQISEKNIPIHFVDSQSTYQKLLDRLFNIKENNKELTVGFDCSFSN